MDAEISPEEVEQLLDADDDVRVVDVRPASAFERGHVPGSENIPFAELPDHIDRLDGAERVVTVCPHGQASVQAARLVASYEGLADDARVESMAGGLEAWEYGLERGDGRRSDREAGSGGNEGPTGGNDGSTGGNDGSTGGNDDSTGGNDDSTGGNDDSTGGNDDSTGGNDGSAGEGPGSAGADAPF